MTGDDVSAGDHPDAKPIYDIDSIQLIRTAMHHAGRRHVPVGPPPRGSTLVPHRSGREPVRATARVPADAPRQEDRGRGRVRPDADLLRRAAPPIVPARAGDLGLLEAAPILAGIFVPKTARGARYLRIRFPASIFPTRSSTGWTPFRRSASATSACRSRWRSSRRSAISKVSGAST